MDPYWFFDYDQMSQAVFEHCSDTLLYVFLWNRSHGHNTVAKYCPDALAALMGCAKEIFASPNEASHGLKMSLSMYFISKSYGKSCGRYQKTSEKPYSQCTRSQIEPEVGAATGPARYFQLFGTVKLLVLMALGALNGRESHGFTLVSLYFNKKPSPTK